MADETPAPLSDAELRELRDSLAGSGERMYGETWIARLLATLAARDARLASAQTEITALCREVRGLERMAREAAAEDDATLAAYREIVAAVAGPGGPLTQDEDTGYSCIFCESHDWLPEGRYADVRHTADCPVTRARALLATPPTPDSAGQS